MCYTKEASIGAFFTGLISSILLIQFGNPNLHKENLLIGIMFIFVSFMQLVDYFIYIDPKCESGSNKLAGYMGPLLNGLQPTVLFILYYYLFANQASKDSVFQKYKYLWIGLNVIYAIVIYGLYVQFWNNSNLCSYKVDGRISWSWYSKNFDTFFNVIYVSMLVINSYLIYSILKTNKQTRYFLTVFLIIIIFFFISKFNYQKHLGEFWCFFVNSVPLFILLIQKIGLFR